MLYEGLMVNKEADVQSIGRNQKQAVMKQVEVGSWEEHSESIHRMDSILNDRM